MVSHGISWCHMVSHGVTWYLMVSHGISDGCTTCHMFSLPSQVSIFCLISHNGITNPLLMTYFSIIFFFIPLHVPTYSLECNGGPSPINGWKAQKPHSSLGQLECQLAYFNLAIHPVFALLAKVRYLQNTWS